MNKYDFMNSPAETNMYTFNTCMLIIKSLLLALIWCILLITSKASVLSKTNPPDQQIINDMNIDMPTVQSPEIKIKSESSDLTFVKTEVLDMTKSEALASNMAETIDTDIDKALGLATDKTTAKAEAAAKTEASTAGESATVESAAWDNGMTETEKNLAVEGNAAVEESETAEPLKGTSDNNIIVMDESEEIEYEEALLKMGYLNESTYDHDYNVYVAVLLFQSSHNLVVDGSWGDSSMQALIKRLKSNMFIYRDKVADPASDGRWIAINLTKRLLTLYEGAEVISKYPIAVGNPPTLTPEGKYLIANKLVNPYWGGGGYAAPVAGGSPYNPLGYRWLGISIGDGYSYGVHGTNSPYSIGTDASHGCIRMPNFCVEQLFELVEIDAPVWIGFDETLVSWGIEQIEY